MPPSNSTPAPENKANTNMNQTLLDAGSALGAPKVVPGYLPVVIVPDGFTAEPLFHETLPPLPDHIRQTVNFHSADSFIGYLNVFKDNLTRVFCAVPATGLTGCPAFEAILDYHTAVANHLPSRCSHRAKYTCPLSLEWLTWAGCHGKPMTQKEFVEFVDDNVVDIVSPKAADVLELARDFNAKTEVKFASKVNAITGGVSLNYQEDTESGGPAAGQLKAFDRMTLSIPVFDGEEPRTIEAKVQWVPRDGKLAVTVKLYRPSQAKAEEFVKLRSAIAAELGIPVWNGGVL